MEKDSKNRLNKSLEETIDMELMSADLEEFDITEGALPEHRFLIEEILKEMAEEDEKEVR